VEYVVPAPPPYGATWAEINRAITDAVGEKRRLLAGDVTANTTGRTVSEDDIRVLTADDEIIIRFVVKDKTQ
jgi:hypothetical protein